VCKMFGCEFSLCIYFCVFIMFIVFLVVGCKKYCVEYCSGGNIFLNVKSIVLLKVILYINVNGNMCRAGNLRGWMLL